MRLKKDKDGKPIYVSGIPVLAYYPHFIKLLKEKGMSQEEIDRLTHNNIAKAFGINIPNTQRQPDFNLAKEYEFDAFGI